MRSYVTIRDVAAAAGVSYQTVSRVINRRPDVAEETRRRVWQVIEELGYQPSAIARSLVSKRTHTLGLITADFSDYFFTQVIVGAEAEARKQGYFFMLCSTERNPDDEPEYFRLLTERQVDGILFARPSTEEDSRHILSLLRAEVPLVTTAYWLPGEKLTVVDVDNVDGGRQATECLIELGHRQIGMITGPAGWKSVNDRSEGYRLALERAGIPFDASFIEYGDWSYQSGYEAMRRLLQKAPPITALFAQNDRMAIGAMRALSEAGRRIPDDMAVIGYDDIPAAAYCHPSLTTIRQPMQQVGEIATRLLIELINDPATERKEVLLKTELIRRETCGRARQGG
ncbi:MAG: LacI family DNA-binding transcriptional regulator [Anaerolineae bacterium]|nr:LacI family DNA-binding transcriptional regulator [Anaerolineae bacterium]